MLLKIVSIDRIKSKKKEIYSFPIYLIQHRIYILFIFRDYPLYYF